MLDFLKDVLLPNSPDEHAVSMKDESKKHQIATCALMLEVANADDEFSLEEKNIIIKLMKKTFSLSEKEVEQLIILSQEHIERSISLYEFTDIINKSFSESEKREVLKNLWRIVFVDEVLHKYEDYYLRKISGNLSFPHSEFIATKIEVKKEMDINKE